MPDQQKRRELIREYKRTPREMGAYRIHNTANDKSFVGSSRDVRSRLNRHKMQLRFGSEENKALAADWARYGEAAFVFETLEALEPLDDAGYDPDKDLKELEEIWLEKLTPWGERGYNDPPPDRGARGPRDMGRHTTWRPRS